MMQAHTINIILVDDHAILRQGLRMLLERQEQIHIVGEASSGEETIRQVTRLQPDLILLDLMLPDTTPAKLVSEIRRVSPRSKILILSGIAEAEPVYEAVDAGIDGYALKHMKTAELVHAIEEVASGNSYLHPSVTRLVLFRAAKDNSASVRLMEGVGADELPLLTNRETQVLKLMASTATNREIAERLVVSEETVRTHVKNILKKLGTPTRTQAVIEAVRIGIISV